MNYVYFSEEEVISAALRMIEEKAPVYDLGEVNNPDSVSESARLRIGDREREVFLVYFLNTKQKIIKAEEMFQGTIDGAAVYPREVVKRALELNAESLVIAHNHPSGNPEPSYADKRITQQLSQALGLMNIRLLDHIIVTHSDSLSFAKTGLL